MNVPVIFPIFNVNDFKKSTYIDSLVSNNIQSAVVSSAISTVNGANLATEPYVNTQISNLQSTLLGTNIPSQLNQNLDTILEIDNFKQLMQQIYKRQLMQKQIKQV